jgi:hypothetical protein
MPAMREATRRRYMYCRVVDLMKGIQGLFSIYLPFDFKSYVRDILAIEKRNIGGVG